MSELKKKNEENNEKWKAKEAATVRAREELTVARKKIIELKAKGKEIDQKIQNVQETWDKKQDEVCQTILFLNFFFDFFICIETYRKTLAHSQS